MRILFNYEYDINMLGYGDEYTKFIGGCSDFVSLASELNNQ
jgi:hypothetical protein